ncbi:hypothetical protein K402DRAFT_420993 [Aulographum hederae CBS 113979]|uniref:F-box domain-containing protein n=1 Tax=Aulographum hederae CBS 113979 TaxID=1176131 RepID=A0A6G1H0C8_9PEZI|nr:hypothetical protein K402DRAFT_420993 [Aulographum hederae CBS 113979]
MAAPLPDAGRFSCLPSEITTQILGNLTAKDLVNTSRSCQFFKQFINRTSHLFIRDVGRRSFIDFDNSLLLILMNEVPLEQRCRYDVEEEKYVNVPTEEYIRGVLAAPLFKEPKLQIWDELDGCFQLNWPELLDRLEANQLTAMQWLGVTRFEQYEWTYRHSADGGETPCSGPVYQMRGFGARLYPEDVSAEIKALPVYMFGKSIEFRYNSLRRFIPCVYLLRLFSLLFGPGVFSRPIFDAARKARLLDDASEDGLSAAGFAVAMAEMEKYPVFGSPENVVELGGEEIYGGQAFTVREYDNEPFTGFFDYMFAERPDAQSNVGPFGGNPAPMFKYLDLKTVSGYLAARSQPAFVNHEIDTVLHAWNSISYSMHAPSLFDTSPLPHEQLEHDLQQAPTYQSKYCVNALTSLKYDPYALFLLKDGSEEHVHYNLEYALPNFLPVLMRYDASSPSPLIPHPRLTSFDKAIQRLPIHGRPLFDNGIAALADAAHVRSEGRDFLSSMASYVRSKKKLALKVFVRGRHISDDTVNMTALRLRKGLKEIKERYLEDLVEVWGQEMLDEMWEGEGDEEQENREVVPETADEDVALVVTEPKWEPEYMYG